MTNTNVHHHTDDCMVGVLVVCMHGCPKITCTHINVYAQTCLCLCITHKHNLPPVGVASSNELEVLRHRFSIHPAVTHDLLDQSNRLCSVGFIKEHYSAQPGVSVPVNVCSSLCSLNEVDDILICNSSMDLQCIIEHITPTSN